MNVANGITVSWRFIDAKGAILAQSSTTLGVGKIVSVNFKRHSDPLPLKSPEQLRTQVQLQLDILTYGVPSESLRRSLAVFGSLDFQTCRLTDSPKSAGREAALEVGLETWTATVRRRDLTHNFSLSFAASCHR